MKTWELIKHLEDGGELEHKFGFNYDKSCLQHLDYVDNLIKHPTEFRLVKPKKKIQLYRYTYGYEDSVCAFAEQSVWTTYTWNEMPLDKDNKLLKTETKEVEID